MLKGRLTTWRHIRREARPARAGRHVLSFWCAALVLLAVGAGPAAAMRNAGATAPLYDRTFKTDQLERLAHPPQLVVLGGSRAMRFDPNTIQRLTGLEAFNFAVQNMRPEDAYAITRYLFWRAPQVRLRCLWAVQVTTVADTPLHPGLLAEGRLTQFLPPELVASQRALGAKVAARQVAWSDEYSDRGYVIRNYYDQDLDQGVSFATSMATYLKHMVPKAADPSPYEQTRARWYFERTLRLFNLHGVSPVIVIMPYHPLALAAFRAAGWQAKLDDFTSYLRELQRTYRFSLLDYTDIASFGGTETGFYDGAHITTRNADLILEAAVKDAPQSFR